MGGQGIVVYWAGPALSHNIDYVLPLSPPLATLSDPVCTSMDQYIILGRIGEGAHGIVFKAKNIEVISRPPGLDAWVLWKGNGDLRV